MEDKLKYAIAWHREDGSIASFFRGTCNTLTHELGISWIHYFEGSTPFSYNEAEEMLARLSDWYKTNAPNVCFGARIHEFIPASIGDEVKSEKAQILDGLKYCLTSAHPAFSEHGHLKKAIAFIEKNTK
jgi:hypothetical protein